MRLTAQIICDIIKEGLGLKPDQIWIYNQRRSMPEDKRLYVVVGLTTMKTFGSTYRPDPTSGLDDDLSQYMAETISVELFSYTTEALERYAQVLGALRSSYSEGIQEAQALKIFPVPVTINDISEIDGATILYRIAMEFNVYRRYSLVKEATYYDDFTNGFETLTESIEG